MYQQGSGRQDPGRTRANFPAPGRFPAKNYARRDRHVDSDPAEYARSTVVTFLPSLAARRTRRAAAKLLGVADRPTDVADVAFIGGAITLARLIGALVLKIVACHSPYPRRAARSSPALFSAGCARCVPLFGRIPSPTVWFMNSVGLNIFIAVVGISAGPGFVNGLKTQGISLFLWGALATTVPLILGMFVGKYIFRFHDALLLASSLAPARRLLLLA